jgi:hypothetical protein
MKYNEHSDLEGQHAFLGASQHAWLNYSKEQLEERWKNERAKREGTELHALAEQLIRKKRKLRGNDTLSSYVNDAIGYGMTPELLLFYSYNCFGTADAIKYDERKKLLRIHDLKTGYRPAYRIDKETDEVILDQVRIYAALFCLEYGIEPSDIDMELRIYQNDEIFKDIPKPEDINDIMEKIISFDKLIDWIKIEER